MTGPHPARYALGFVMGGLLAWATRTGFLQGLARADPDGRAGIWDLALHLEDALGRDGAALAVLAIFWIGTTAAWLLARSVRR